MIEYDPEFVAYILWLDAQPPEAGFDNIEDLLEYLNRENRHRIAN